MKYFHHSKFHCCSSVFHTEYDYGAWFHIKHNHNMPQKYKWAVVVEISVLVFNCIYYLVCPQHILLLTHIDMDGQWYVLI